MRTPACHVLIDRHSRTKPTALRAWRTTRRAHSRAHPERHAAPELALLRPRHAISSLRQNHPVHQPAPAAVDAARCSDTSPPSRVPYCTQYWTRSGIETDRRAMMIAQHILFTRSNFSCLESAAVSINHMKSPVRSVEPKTRRGFDVDAYLESTGPSRTVVTYRRGEVIFSQGDPASDIRYIQQGHDQAGGSLAGRQRGGGRPALSWRFFRRGHARGPVSAPRDRNRDRRKPRAAHREGGDGPAAPRGIRVPGPLHLVHADPEHDESRPTWSISCSIPAKSAWPGPCSCCRATARPIPSTRCRESLKKPSPT